MKMYFTFTVLMCFILNITGYPIETMTDETKPDSKDEVHYPNGTVVGKYVYMDSEGNPIHVQYYADNSSYGVELNSVKVVGTPPTESQLWPLNNTFDILKPIENPFGLQTGRDSRKPAGKTKIYRTLNKSRKFTTPPDPYEVFYEKEINVPKKGCGDDKVKIYLGQEKRKIRNVVDDYKVSEYCDQF